MINWTQIDTVLLDMDGTLLDLNFDNYFWLEYLPQRFSEEKNMSSEQAKAFIYEKYQKVEGTLQWYSTTYWTEVLGINVVALKHEVRHLVTELPFCHEFLDELKMAEKDIVMVTNAHHDSLNLKMDITGLAHKFDKLITVHEFSLPKEDIACWSEVQKLHPFDCQRTLLVDDNLNVLKSAEQYGIANLLAVYQPDSKAPKKDVEHFQAIHSFQDILPILKSEKVS
ncbi:MAG: GMP/IMP nucleotidase [Gammaproteobacteria bacterium]|nr:GMP/IMP nucleotidase [Gammaproteobacteria bacterium]